MSKKYIAPDAQELQLECEGPILDTSQVNPGEGGQLPGEGEFD